MALFSWQEDLGWGCPEGQVWNVRLGKCIPKRYESSSEYPSRQENVRSAFGNIGAGLGDIVHGCPQGTMWDRDNQECRPIYEFNPAWGGNVEKGDSWKDILPEMPGYVPPETTDITDTTDTTDVTDRENIIPKEDLLPEEPPSLYPMGDVWDSLTKWLTADASQATEDAYFDKRMERLDKDFDRQRDQVMENLNIKGLYYSGVRNNKLDEVEREREDAKEYERNQFEYERWNRDIQRYSLASQFALGARAQEIQWALGRGQLQLQQLDLALQETLGIGALELQEKGLGMNFLLGLYNIGIAQEQNEMARQQMWLNTVNLLYQMGYSEAEVNAAWAQMMGQGTNPAY